MSDLKKGVSFNVRILNNGNATNKKNIHVKKFKIRIFLKRKKYACLGKNVYSTFSLTINSDQNQINNYVCLSN